MRVQYRIGEHKGIGRCECAKCSTSIEGDRWEYLRVMQGATHGAKGMVIGYICASCLEDVNK